EHSCFVCKSPDGDFMKCSLSKCGRSYHEKCLSRYDCGNKEKNICPRHTCLTCYNENPKNVMARKGTMLQCTECPTAYHSYHTCIAAGSKMVGPNKLVCPDHFLGKHKSSKEQRKIPRKYESSKKKRKTAIKQKSSNEQRKSQTINVLYCCICCQGGELVCCETCPNAYHKSCINVEISEGDFFCEDCTKRKHLTYGAIIWGKTGKYRWWPGKIMHPDNIPQNVQKIKHLDGDFPVLYFGTGEYDWLHRGRVIPYAEHHKEMILEGSSAVNTLKIKFKKSLKEASEAYDEYQLLRASENNMSEEPEEYKPLKVNKAVPPAQIVPLDVTASSSPCLCDPSTDNPCGPESSCLNLSLLMECHSGICNADDRCKNRRFQKRQYASVKRIRTRNRGWGLITCQEIKKADFVIEYVGEVITYKEYRKRAETLQAHGKSNFYFLQLDSTRIIDAGPCGNAARFINHSCDPNCEMVKWSVNGDVRIGIFALYDIAAGEELTFNYECDTSCQQKCFCGSANCSGIIGRNSSSSMEKGSSAEELIKSFPPGGESYSKALEQLQSRFGKEDLLIEVCVRATFVKSKLRALEVVGVGRDKYAAMLYPLVESSLPDDTLRAWQKFRVINHSQRESESSEQKEKNSSTHRMDLDGLLSFLLDEIEGEERVSRATQCFTKYQT
ncbi:histone-lysine N-methyltransferase NSD2-like, partial [Stegodyphus dumicola]|uniref:histone-lysine N-methyltransferase NSD2-like n=1 Tax=Stegodyphus dumicola TaxID=202533 RepID=UPI0015A8024C